MSIFSFPTFGARPDSFAESLSLDAPASSASAPVPLVRTTSKESLASRALAREKSFRKRQVSRQATHTSAEHRAAESARRHRKKLAVKPKPQASTNTFKRCFNFFVSALIPFFDAPIDLPASTDLTSYVLSSSLCNLALDSDQSSSEVPAYFSDRNSGRTDAADAALQDSVKVSTTNSTKSPNAPVDEFSAEVSPPQFTAKQIRAGEHNPKISARIERLNRERAAVASAMRHAQEKERKRIARRRLFEQQKAQFGESAAIQMQVDRDAAEEIERRKQERIDLIERQEMLLQGELGVHALQRSRAKAAQEELNHQLHYPRTDCGCSLATIYDYKKRVVEGMREYRDGRVSSQQYQLWWGDDNDDLGTPKDTYDIYRYSWDRTSIRRSTYRRYHPYSTSARPVCSTSGRHFNNSDATGSAIAARILQYESHCERLAVFADRTRIAQIERYANYWEGLATPVEGTTLKFIDIPWPLRTAPNIPAEITSERVQEFVLFARLGTTEATAEERKEAAQYELENLWFPDHITDWILSRVEDRDERKAVRDGADRVQRALVMLLASAESE